MHVCFFNRSYWPDFGATGQLLTELAEDLVRLHGWDVTVVAGPPLGAGAPRPPTEERHGVRIVRAAGTTFDPSRLAGRAANYLTYFGSAAIAALGQRRADVVVGMTDPPVIGLAALVAAGRSGAPFVFLCEDVFPDVAVLLEGFQSATANRTLAGVSRLLLRRASRVVAIGETMQRRLVDGKAADPGKIVVIHNWADCDAVTPGPRDNGFARRHGLADRFVVLHAGNIGLSQDLDIVLHAADRLRDRPDIAFVFVGDGSRRAELQERAARRDLRHVMFLPYQPRDMMAESYASADVALISLRRGLAGAIVPSKLYTVLASGRACLAAVEDECEVAAIVRGAGCGVVMAPGDAAALAASVVALEADRPRVRELGARARAAALAFDRRGQVATYDALLRETASRW